MKAYHLFCLAGSLTLTAGAATFSATPVADAFVSTGADGQLAGNNYGGAGTLAVSAGGMPEGQMQTVLMFNLGAAVSSFNSTFGAGQWTLESVSLRLTATAPDNSIFNSTAAGLMGVSWVWSDAWQEGSGTIAAPGLSGITFTSLQTNYVTEWDQYLGTLVFDGSTSGTSTFALTTGPAFFSDLLAGSNLSLRLFAADASMSGVFNSRSFGTAENGPLLTLVAIPEPSSAAAGAAALLMLLAARRRSPGILR